MGLFDTVKLKANALAADAGRAGKVSAAQAHTVVLQNDIRKAERELGHSAFSLIESGAIAHPDLEAATARLRDARQALADKETEIEALRGRMPETDDVAAATPADDAPVAAPGDAETEMPEQTAAAPAAEEPPAAASVTKKPASQAKKPAAKKPAPKKVAAPKPAAKKPAPKKQAAKKTAATKQPADKIAPANDA